MPSLSTDSRRHAEAALNEPAESEQAAAVSKFAAEVLEAIGSEAAEQLQWAQLPTLRQCKWDAASALKKMKKLAEFRSKNTQYFDGATASEFRGQAALGMMSHLPTRTARYELVLLVDGQKLKPYAKSYSIQEMMRYSCFYMPLLLEDEMTQIHGAIILENLEDYPIFALNSMKGMGPSAMKASFDWLGVSPLRLRGIYGCHTPWYVGMMLAMVKPFMSKKLRDRVSLHDKDTAAMLAEAGLDPKDVPPEYGGTLQGFDYGWHLKG